MICQNDYSYVCLSKERDYHWLWIVLPVSLLICFLLYIFSRPNYARLSSHAYQLIKPPKNIISLHPTQKQQNYALNQHAKYSTPTSSSRIVFEQSRESNDNHKTSNFPTSSDGHPLSNNTSLNNSNDASLNLNPYQWSELRTPTLANYPDLIDAVEARRINNELNPGIKKRPLLPDDVLTLINKGFGESDPYPANINLGRIWFFLEYNPYLRQLYLTIVKARDLRSMTNCPPTTFVRAELLPTLNTTFSTEIIRENVNPDYMSETTFNINLSEFARNVLKLTVHQVDKDVFHTPIGTIYYPLDHLLLAQRAKGHAVWRNLLPEYGDPSAIGLIQIRATVWYDAPDECLNIYVHSLRATGIVKQVYRVYVHASVAIHDLPVVPEEHIESSHSKNGPIVSLEQNNETIYDQLFRFLIYKHEFNDMTVVLDVYRRSLGDEFFDDILLGRTVLVSPDMLAKNLNNEPLPVTKVEKSDPEKVRMNTSTKKIKK